MMGEVKVMDGITDAPSLRTLTRGCDFDSQSTLHSLAVSQLAHCYFYCPSLASPPHPATLRSLDLRLSSTGKHFTIFRFPAKINSILFLFAFRLPHDPFLVVILFEKVLTIVLRLFFPAS